MGTILRHLRAATGRPLFGLAVLALPVLLLAACGSEDEAGDGRPTVVVTTSILGDVVADLVGDRAEIVTVMPPGADPHTFQASAQQAAAMASADALVVNGAGFEEGLRSVVDNAAAEGVPAYEAISAVDTLDADEDHAEDDHGDEDPHFFTDPLRMAEAVRGITSHLRATVPALDDQQLQDASDDLVEDLESLDAEIDAVLAEVPADRRVLVTDHGVFGYFADRYDFDVLGVVVPAGTSSDGVSGGALAELAERLREAGVSAVFTSSGDAAALTRTLADEVGEVAVVELFAESLGPEGSAGDTYRGMMLTNAERIADALAP